MKNKYDKNKMVWIGLAALVIMGGYIYVSIIRPGTQSAEKAENVATVNQVAISKKTYDKQVDFVVASYKAQGIEVTSESELSQVKKQVLEDLISEELLVQGASSAGIKITADDVEKQYQAILTGSGGADKLAAELAKNNLTEADLRENISKQMAIQEYLSQNIDVASITVTDSEVAKFYEDYSIAQKAAGQNSLPALKDISEEIRQQLLSNKRQALITDFIASLNTKAKIVILI